MQTIELNIDEALLAKLDRITQKLLLPRVALIQQSKASLQQQEVLAQDHRHAEGYAHIPIQPGEFDKWENVRV